MMLARVASAGAARARALAPIALVATQAGRGSKGAFTGARSAPVTTQAGKDEGGTSVPLGKTTTATGVSTSLRDQDWMTRGENAAEKVAAAGEMQPEFGLHRAGLGFDLTSLAEAVRSSWGGRAPQAAEAIAKMVADPTAARRVPFPPPQRQQQRQQQQQAAKGKEGEEEDEGEEGMHNLPLRWRRLTPDAGADEWYEIPEGGGGRGGGGGKQ